jgi:hypothetical protein
LPDHPPNFYLPQQFLTANQNYQLLNIKQEFMEVPLNPNQPDDDLEDIDFKGIENLIKQVDQPLTPEVLNFDDIQQFPTQFQYFHQFPSTSSNLHNYQGYFYNPNWTS